VGRGGEGGEVSTVVVVVVVVVAVVVVVVVVVVVERRRRSTGERDMVPLAQITRFGACRTKKSIN